MDRRQFVTAATVGVVVLGVGAAGWMLYGPPSKKPPQRNLPPVAVDLMTPGPLGEQALGKDDAPVTIIEYASATCPHCARFHETTFPELKKNYIDTGKVRFIFREFPLDEVAMLAFVVARCAPKEQYFPFIEALFQQQEKWAVNSPIPPLLAIAKQAGFTEQAFHACIINQNIFDGVNWTYEHGQYHKVKSTPSFFINGTLYAGGMTIERMSEVIDPLLKADGVKQSDGAQR